jgi:polysaccharide export outer membrane protein
MNWGKTLKYRTAVLAACLGLVGCGTIYTSPKVSTRGVENADIRVIKMTDQTAYAANLSAFAPQRLPAVFNSVPGARAAGAAGALPQPTTDGGSRPRKPQTFLPPAATPGPYRIGVSDVLLLATPAGGSTVQELSGLLAAQNKRQGYSVQGDGSIAIPDVGRIQVAGMTLDAAEAAVFDALVSKNIEPAFSLDVAEFNSQRATIGGAVGNPTIAPITPKPLYLEEAIQLAGGIAAQNLDYTSIRMYRDGKLYQISARDLYKSSGRVRLIDSDSVFVDTEYELDDAQTYFAEQITLNNAKRADRDQALNRMRTEFNMRNDQIKVAQSNFKSRLELGAVKRQYVYRIGEFKEQGRFALPFEQRATLADALYDSKGLSTKEADLSQIYVLRRSGDPREVNASTAYHLNGSNPVQMLTATVFELRPNDIIFVSEQPVTAWNRVIAQITPQLLSAVVNATSP